MAGESNVHFFRHYRKPDKDAVKLGFVSDCEPLSEVDYAPYLDWKLEDIRRELGIEEDLLRAYYAIEKRRYPESSDSQRLLD